MTVRSDVLRTIKSIAGNPRPRGTHKLVGSISTYRVRIGSYCILYEVDDKSRTVTVYAVGHRSGIYP